MSKSSFDEASAGARCRHQNALTDAHAAFRKAVAESDRERYARYLATEAAWNEVKSDANHPEHDKRSSAFNRAKEPADHGPAREALARAIAGADSALHVELRQIGAEHGVLTGTPPVARG